MDNPAVRTTSHGSPVTFLATTALLRISGGALGGSQEPRSYRQGSIGRDRAGQRFSVQGSIGVDYFALPGNQVLLRTQASDTRLRHVERGYALLDHRQGAASSPSLDFENNLVPGLTGIAAGATSLVFELGDLGDKFPGIRQLALGPFYEPT